MLIDNKSTIILLVSFQSPLQTRLTCFDVQGRTKVDLE